MLGVDQPYIAWLTTNLGFYSDTLIGYSMAYTKYILFPCYLPRYVPPLGNRHMFTWHYSGWDVNDSTEQGLNDLTISSTNSTGILKTHSHRFGARGVLLLISGFPHSKANFRASRVNPRDLIIANKNHSGWLQSANVRWMCNGAGRMEWKRQETLQASRGFSESSAVRAVSRDVHYQTQLLACLQLLIWQMH